MGASAIGTDEPRPQMRHSLRNRLAFVFFAITLVAIAALYLYVAPGLRSRLVNERLTQLATAARRDSFQIVPAIRPGSRDPVGRRARRRWTRPGSPRATASRCCWSPGPRAGSSCRCRRTRPSSARPLRSRGSPRCEPLRPAGRRTGTEGSTAGTVAEAAVPVISDGRVTDVIVYSSPVSDIVHSVSIVRQQILIAGGIALLLALVGGYLVARALAQRVKRLELAAEQVAAGNFEQPIPVDSRDELGQLAVAFNQMQRQLAQLESAREKFIATASHELRTPIFSLGGFVELLEDEDLDEETRRRFLEQVKDQVERLRKLSVDLLDLSKLESGSLELRPEQVDLGELTRSVSGEFEPALAQHDAHLELRLARAIDVQCDPVRVAQIMRILIDNALTHTASGTRIVVTAGRDDGHVRLAVRDDGQGIDPGALGRIFEPFYTGDDVQGSGLGLAIASELAERMEGRLLVSSGPGQTVFTLELPV